MSISDYIETWDGVLNLTNGRGSMGHKWNWRCENKGAAPCKQSSNDFFGLQVGRSY